MIRKAIMVPHPPIALAEVGRGEEKKIQQTLDAYGEACSFIADDHPDTVIILSPHALMYRDYFNISGGKDAYGDMARFHAGRVAFRKEYDTEFVSCLTQMLEEEGFPGGTQYDRDPLLDHGTMVPLYFLTPYLPDCRIVRIGLSGLPLSMHYRLGMYIQKTAETLGRHIAVIASGDLAHCQKEDGPYGYKAEGPAYDEAIMKTMGTAAFNELFDYPASFLHASMECGHRAFVILAGILDGLSVTPHVLSHEATFGVGYGIVTFDIGSADNERHFLDQHRAVHSSDPLVQLAVQAAAYSVRTGKTMPVPSALPASLQKPAGCFVSVHEDGDLRGCIGTIFPVHDTLAEEIVNNARSACLRDPRFSAITEDELPFLEISVDVMGEPEVIHDRSQLDVHRYGIICTSKNRRGLLLPDLEGVDTVEQQIAIACSKGGFDPDEEDLVIERFEAVRHV